MTGEDKEFIRVKECIAENITALGISGTGEGRLEIRTGITVTDGKDIQFFTGTGTKIGTSTNQKIGFWNKTTIVQAVLATGSTTDQLITAMQNIGLIRQS